MKFIGIAITIAVFASCLVAGAEEEQAPGSWAVSPGVAATFSNGVRPQPAIEIEKTWRASPSVAATFSNGRRPRPQLIENTKRPPDGKPIYEATFGFP